MTHVTAIACGQWTRQNQRLTLGATAWNQSFGGGGMALAGRAPRQQDPWSRESLLLPRTAQTTPRPCPLGERHPDPPWNLPWALP